MGAMLFVKDSEKSIAPMGRSYGGRQVGMEMSGRRPAMVRALPVTSVTLMIGPRRRTDSTPVGAASIAG